jgi:hypothetical protein
MSFVSQRSPEWKTHKQRNHLTSALGTFISSKQGGITGLDLYAYELKGDKYELMWHIAAGTPNTELPWSKTIYKPYVAPHRTCQCPDCTS